MSVAIALASNELGEKIFDVLGVDVPTPLGKERAKLIKEGNFPFHGGDEKLSLATRECFSAGNLFATTDSRALSLADYVIVSVNLDIDFHKSPPVADFENYTPAIVDIGEQISPDTLIIINTTIPPGTCERVILPVIEKAFERRGFYQNSVLWLILMNVLCPVQSI